MVLAMMAAMIETCDRPSGYVDNALDCDDTSAFVSPVATETCDEIDNNCDGVIDENGALGFECMVLGWG